MIIINKRDITCNTAGHGKGLFIYIPSGEVDFEEEVCRIK